MATTTSIDYDRLNEAAQIVFDVAKARGEHEGGERERLKAAAAHADSTLFAADVFIGFARDAHVREDAPAARAFAAYGRRMLGQTPLLAESKTMTAIGLLDSHWLTQEGATERMTKAREAIRAAREKLREEYDGLGEIR